MTPYPGRSIPYPRVCSLIVVSLRSAAAAAAAATTTMAAAATATAAGTDNNQLRAVKAIANGSGDGNSNDDEVTVFGNWCCWGGPMGRVHRSVDGSL